MSKRTPNFSAKEEDLLLQLVKKYTAIIENKKTDAVSSKEKSECWKKISAEFNCQQNVEIRNYLNLKNKYENIKKTTKRKFADNKKYLLGTGGGPALPPEKLTDIELDVVEILGTQITGLPHEFDDDAIPIIDMNANEEASILKPKETGSAKEIVITSEDRLIEEEREIQPKKMKLDNGFDNIKNQSDWTSYNPSQLREPKSTPLRQRAHRPQIRDKITQWAQEKVRISEQKNSQNIEEFKTMMRQREEKHLLELKLMQEKHEAELALKREMAEKEFMSELALKREMAEKEFILKSEMMRQEHLLRLELIKSSKSS